MGTETPYRDATESDEKLRTRVCPKCGFQVHKRDGVFFSRRIGYHHGLVCEPCNSLWNDPDDSFIDALREYDGLLQELVEMGPLINTKGL